jgi:hypothetical protein
LQNRIVASAVAEDTQTVNHHPSDSESAATDLAAILAERVRAFIADPSDGDFDALACAIHGYQYRCNAPYRRYVDRLGTPRPRRWRDIPAVPATAFKESVLACAGAERVYESSGTSQGAERPSRHYVSAVDLYRRAALAGFAHAVLPAGVRRRFLVAAPERATHPASSLGEMVSWVRAAHDRGATPSFLGAPYGGVGHGAALDLAGLAAALDALDPREPIVLLAVTGALLRLIDAATARDRRWRLPAGSLVVDTGGCKGYARDVPRAELLARYADRLGVAPEQVVNEYGMTELGSQAYARGAGPLMPPPWLRTLVWDPDHDREQTAGRPGLLRHFDLTNLGSVLAIQTDDVGCAVEGGIVIIGRAPFGETRGCSLLVAS